MDKYYYPRYAPQKWVDDIDFHRYASRSRVYVDPNCDVDFVRDVIKYREPVNIAGKQLFDTQYLYSQHGYAVSAYTTIYRETGNIAPNIGVYTYTPILYDNKFVDAHIYNAIGYAFDSREQPDYIYFSGINFDKQELIARYIRIFEKVVACARYESLPCILWSMVGCGHFSELYPDGQARFISDIFTPAFMNTINKYNTEFEMIIMGSGEIFPGVMDTNIRFPMVIEKIDTRTTLIVNAWDPHSIPGNGNGGDRSLDGDVGNCTAIGKLGWGITNTRLLKQSSFVIC